MGLGGARWGGWGWVVVVGGARWDWVELDWAGLSYICGWMELDGAG